MKKLLIALFLLISGVAYAANTKAQLQTQANATININGVNAITGIIMNSMINAMISSTATILDAQTFILTQTFSVNPIFSACTGFISGNGSSALTCSNTISSTTPIRTGGYLVNTLPSGLIGMRAYVTDAISCTFLGSLTGGGSNYCPVTYNGSAWVGG